MTTRIVNKTLHISALPDIDNTDTVYIDCLIFVVGSQKQTPIEVINNKVLQNCVVVYQPSTAQQTMQPQVIAIQNDAVYTDDGDTPQADSLSGRVLANNFICTANNNIKDFSLSAYGLINADFLSFYNICNHSTIQLELILAGSTQQHTIILEHLYKNLAAQPNFVFEGDDIAKGYEIFKTNCIFLLKTSMPAINAVFEDNIILQNLELVDGCELHINETSANIQVQSIVYKNMKFEEQQSLLGLKNIVCRNDVIKFLGDNNIAFDPHFKVITNILSTNVDVNNCTADTYIGGKIIL